MSPTRTPNADDEVVAVSMAMLEDEIVLSHAIHFAWGYPDFIRQAFTVLQRLNCEYIPADSNTELSWKQLRKALETADSSSARFLVAGALDTPQNVLDYLSRADDKDVTKHVAENPNAHPLTLKRLAKHPEPSVRMAVSENEKTPESALLFLTFDENPDIRYCMAENPKMPQTILEVLSGDQNPYVAERARASLKRVNPGEVVVGDFSRVARRRLDRSAAT